MKTFIETEEGYVLSAQVSNPMIDNEPQPCGIIIVVEELNNEPVVMSLTNETAGVLIKQLQSAINNPSS